MFCDLYVCSSLFLFFVNAFFFFERVTPLVRVAPWHPGVDVAQVYPFQDEGDLPNRRGPRCRGYG